LFNVEDVANAEGDFKSYINPNSLQIVHNAFAEPQLAKDEHQQPFQFLRKGYFVLDRDTNTNKLVFNRTVTLKDAWAKEVKKG
jgi:glutaminyl-tRNA synthetase